MWLLLRIRGACQVWYILNLWRANIFLEIITTFKKQTVSVLFSKWKRDERQCTNEHFSDLHCWIYAWSVYSPSNTDSKRHSCLMAFEVCIIPAICQNTSSIKLFQYGPTVGQIRKSDQANFWVWGLWFDLYRFHALASKLSCGHVVEFLKAWSGHDILIEWSLKTQILNFLLKSCVLSKTFWIHRQS